MQQKSSEKKILTGCYNARTDLLNYRIAVHSSVCLLKNRSAPNISVVLCFYQFVCVEVFQNDSCHPCLILFVCCKLFSCVFVSFVYSCSRDLIFCFMSLFDRIAPNGKNKV